MELMAQAAEGRGTRRLPPAQQRQAGSGRPEMPRPGFQTQLSHLACPLQAQSHPWQSQAFTELRTELLSDEDTEAHVTQLVSELSWS